MIKLFMHHIFLTISRYIKEGKQAKNETISDIERAVHYFNENYNKPISIEQYAQEHLMSVNWFIHSFKKVMNIPPMQYIVSLRIAAAKGYLENSNKNINEIASIVGYENALYFSRLFKKYTGYSPSEYKKSLKSNVISYSGIPSLQSSRKFAVIDADQHSHPSLALGAVSVSTSQNSP